MTADLVDREQELLEKVATLTSELLTLQAENKSLHDQATVLHEKHHSTTLQVKYFTVTYTIYTQ